MSGACVSLKNRRKQQRLTWLLLFLQHRVLTPETPANDFVVSVVVVVGGGGGGGGGGGFLLLLFLFVFSVVCFFDIHNFQKPEQTQNPNLLKDSKYSDS